MPRLGGRSVDAIAGENGEENVETQKRRNAETRRRRRGPGGPGAPEHLVSIWLSVGLVWLSAGRAFSVSRLYTRTYGFRGGFVSYGRVALRSHGATKPRSHVRDDNAKNRNQLQQLLKPWSRARTLRGDASSSPYNVRGDRRRGSVRAITRGNYELRITNYKRQGRCRHGRPGAFPVHRDGRWKPPIR